MGYLLNNKLLIFEHIKNHIEFKNEKNEKHN